MNFNSLNFLLFFLIVFIVYWLISRFKNITYSNLFLLISSYIFYSLWDWRFLGLIILSSICDYIIGIKIFESKYLNQKKLLLKLSLFLNLGLLFTFKYFNFFISSFIDFFSINDGFTVKIILPVGISFYTFQTLSYTIDIYNGKIHPTKNIISFLTFVSFFPQLVAGPIERAANLLPQFNNLRIFNFKNTLNGISLIMYGLFKKIVVADKLAIYVNSVFSNIDFYNSASLIIASVFFSFQIYCDFSGYSLIARGLSKLLGFELMVNFSKPYLASSIKDFWRKWHISLSTWFRDYLYIPLGGSKRTFLRTIYNILIVFVISGLWHGANWTFVCWGFLHGLFLVTESLVIKYYFKLIEFIPNFLKSCLVFIIVNFLWIIFRSKNINDSIKYFNKVIEFNFSFDLNMICAYKGPLNLILSFLFIILIMFSYKLPKDLKFKKSNNFLLFNLITILIMVFLGTKGENEFIYFQF